MYRAHFCPRYSITPSGFIPSRRITASDARFAGFATATTIGMWLTRNPQSSAACPASVAMPFFQCSGSSHHPISGSPVSAIGCNPQNPANWPVFFTTIRHKLYPNCSCCRICRSRNSSTRSAAYGIPPVMNRTTWASVASRSTSRRSVSVHGNSRSRSVSMKWFNSLIFGSPNPTPSSHSRKPMAAQSGNGIST
jgi:hypothetical protein